MQVRDKVAASKRKGIWMGGAVPLAYRVEDRALHVVEDDAEFVRSRGGPGRSGCRAQMSNRLATANRSRNGWIRHACVRAWSSGRRAAGDTGNSPPASPNLPTVKQHLAAIRMLFDWLVTGQVVATNPAHSVRGPKHVVKTGKTTVLTFGGRRHELDQNMFRGQNRAGTAP